MIINCANFSNSNKLVIEPVIEKGEEVEEI